MSIITWFTQPKDKYASYYMYDNETLNFVRIRLALGRGRKGKDDGSPFIQIYKKRSVGFSLIEYSEVYLKSDNWTTQDNKLMDEGNPLGTDPVENHFVYDTTNPKRFIHIGDRVTKKPILPAGVTEKMLYELAQKHLNMKRDCIILTAPNASRKELVDRLRELLGWPKEGREGCGCNVL